MHKISIITSSYNSKGFLRETAESIANQTEQDYEWIVVDDNSTDGSRDIIRKIAVSDSRIKPVFLPLNRGPAGARNAGIEQATGRFIAFLDSDDVWLPEKLQLQLAFMKETGTPLSFTAYQRMDENGTPERIVSVPETVDYHSLLKSNVIGMLTAVYDRTQLGLRFLPAIRKRQDYALWLQILKEGHVARGLDQVLARYRIHGNSISRNKLDAARYQWRVYRELEKLGRCRSAWYFAHYAVHGLLKHR